MAIIDILAQSGDTQDFIVEIPNGNASYIPNDILIYNHDPMACSEIPLVTGGGSNIFIMSE